MRRSLLLPPLTALLLSCNAAPAPGPDQGPPGPAIKTYGQSIGASPAAKLVEVVRNPGAHSDKSVVVEGSVRRACTRRGCWMELAESMDDASPGCRVTFKDYGFFVPTDSPGAQARVEGVVKTRELSAEEVGHMEREGARFPSKQPDGTAREVRLVATGVELRRL
jgi:hypothetical protein